GGLGSGERPTGNVCTPGTHVYLGDTQTETHCIASSSDTYDGDRWIDLEVVVLPDGNIYHLVEGDTVMHYRDVVIGGDFLPEGYPVEAGTPVREGYIALQAESHATEFRNIRIQKIE